MEDSLYERGSVALIDPRPRIGALTCCLKMTTQTMRREGQPAFHERQFLAESGHQQPANVFYETGGDSAF